MKNTVTLLLVFSLSLCACGSRNAISIDMLSEEHIITWQEQYDLGIRYLSESNYEEAIIAFTVAIEIDPKRAPAYVGRGDAYVGQAYSMAAAQGAADNYSSAVTDYLAAIDLDPLAAEVYEKLGRVYIEQGDFDTAADIWERGYEATKDERLSELLDMLRIEMNGPATALQENLGRLRAELEGPVTVTGRIIFNPEAYEGTWHAYMGQYQDEEAGIHCDIYSFGIRFEQEQEVSAENGFEYIGEAGAGGLDRDTMGNLVGSRVEFTGHILFNGVAEITGPYPPGANGENEFTVY